MGVKHKIKVLRIKKYAFIVIFSKIEALEVLKKNSKNCQNAEPHNLVCYPLIHSGLPNILKLSNFQVLYHFGKLLSSGFQNCYRFCNILKTGHFTGQQKKGDIFFAHPLYQVPNTPHRHVTLHI